MKSAYCLAVIMSLVLLACGASEGDVTTTTETAEPATDGPTTTTTSFAGPASSTTSSLPPTTTSSTTTTTTLPTTTTTPTTVPKTTTTVPKTTTTVPTTTTTPEPQTHNVSIGDFFFSPASLTISVGDTVRWTRTGSVTHTTTGSEWDSGSLGSGATFSHTFTTAGTFNYFCAIHPTTMQATLVVAS